MVVPVTNIVEKDFDPQSTKDLNLSLLIGPDRLSYLVIEPNSQKLLALSAYSLDNKNSSTTLVKNIEELFKKDSLLSKTYDQVSINLYTRRFTIIPNALFELSQTKLLFETAMHIDNNDNLQVGAIDKIDSTVIYSIDKELDDLLQARFPTASRNSAAGPIIQNALANFEQEEFVVIALLQAGSICLTVLHKGQLLLHQVFGFRNAEDCLYYVLLAYKNLGLSTEKHPIFLAGELIQESEIYKLLYQYFRQISFVKRNEGIKYGTEALRLPNHFYFDLFSIAVANR